MVSAVEQLNQGIDEPLTTRKSKSSGGGGNSNTTKTEGRKENRGRPRKPAAAAAEKTIVPRMVDVEVPTEGEPQLEKSPPKKARPKKPTAAAAKKIGVTTENVASLIQTCGDIVGNREGFEIWKLDEKECKQIADPLSRIIARSDYLERITNEYGDVIALSIAAGTVVIPRMMIQASMNKEKKNNEIEKLKEKKEHDRKSAELRNEGNENRTFGNRSGGIDESITHGNQIIGTEFHKSIPIIQG